LANRLAVLREHPEAAFHCPPDARDAAREVHELVQQALATGGGTAPRDPVERDPVERDPVDPASIAPTAAAEPLLAAALLTPADDLCLLDPGPDPRLRAGVVTAPSGWRLDQRLGQDLRALHAPVEGLEARLGPRMRTFVERLSPARIFARGNWFLYDDPGYWRPEAAALSRLPATLGASPEVTAHLWLRCERQTLRRLPKTRWLLFTIRPCLLPVTELVRWPMLAAQLRDAIGTLDEQEYRARRLDRVGRGLLSFLEGIAPPCPSETTDSPARSDA
ncbi:MAG: DUF3445 domain-containing protein, partial [Pseudomonadales bacterium]|nr:DUF3445 domain-containing protein [Pseudomonadales bacterium]